MHLVGGVLNIRPRWRQNSWIGKWKKKNPEGSSELQKDENYRKQFKNHHRR